MSETKLYIHATWSTNHSKNQFNEEIKKEICKHIVQNAKSKSIEIIDINGFSDHIHVLINLHATQNLSQIMHNIKGESSNWINTLELTTFPFEWQEGYTAVSVSLSKISFLKKYLALQEILHKNLTFSEEIKLLKMDKLKITGE